MGEIVGTATVLHNRALMQRAGTWPRRHGGRSRQMIGALGGLDCQARGTGGSDYENVARTVNIPIRCGFANETVSRGEAA